MKLSRNTKRFINYVLGPLLFLWLSYSLYLQIKNQKGLKEAWEQIQQTPVSRLIIYFSVVLILMMVNWLIEAVKWQRILKNVQQISLAKAFKAILCGVSFSATTPNRVGEYAGRVLFLEEGNRLRSVSLTIVCSMSQLIITKAMGCMGMFFLWNELSGSSIFEQNRVWIMVLIFAAPAGLLFLLFFYFRISYFTRLIEKISWFKKNKYLVEEMERAESGLLLQLLFLSLFRFTVFSIQYYLMFHLFGVAISFWQSWCVISVAFLVLAVIPSIAIAELGLRGTIIWELMKFFTVNSLGVTIATVVIWFVNLIVPAIAGTVLIAGVKLYQKKTEEA